MLIPSSGALDQTRTYHEEGTPVCFSRVSSLSSLHSKSVMSGVTGADNSLPGDSRATGDMSHDDKVI